MCCYLIVINLQLFFNEYKVANDEVSNPLKLVRFETVFMFVPSTQVLTDTLTEFLNMVKKNLLHELIGFLALPHFLYHFRFDDV